jgi:hypothetical protein
VAGGCWRYRAEYIPSAPAVSSGNRRLSATSRIRRGSKFTIGDDTPSSPFEVLRAQLEDEKRLDERREQVRWLIRSGEL